MRDSATLAIFATSIPVSARWQISSTCRKAALPEAFSTSYSHTSTTSWFQEERSGSDSARADWYCWATQTVWSPPALAVGLGGPADLEPELTILSAHFLRAADLNLHNPEGRRVLTVGVFGSTAA